jgi:hypothetical protein
MLGQKNGGGYSVALDTEYTLNFDGEATWKNSNSEHGWKDQIVG